MELPTHGGRWTRHPKTGALKPEEPVPVTPEIPAQAPEKPKEP